MGIILSHISQFIPTDLIQDWSKLIYSVTLRMVCHTSPGVPDVGVNARAVPAGDVPGVGVVSRKKAGRMNHRM